MLRKYKLKCEDTVPNTFALKDKKNQYSGTENQEFLALLPVPQHEMVRPKGTIKE